MNACVNIIYSYIGYCICKYKVNYGHITKWILKMEIGLF